MLDARILPTIVAHACARMFAETGAITTPVAKQYSVSVAGRISKCVRFIRAR